MNRHVAALALVGWYLMVPPSMADTWVCGQSVSAVLSRDWFGWGKGCDTMAHTVDFDAPLSQWHQGDPFETLAECEANRETLRKSSESATPSSRSASHPTIRALNDRARRYFRAVLFLDLRRRFFRLAGFTGGVFSIRVNTS